MSNICVIRHQGYTKSKVQFPYRHNHRIVTHHSNENIDPSLTQNNSILVNNLQENETYLTAFKRIYQANEFHGQLKVNGEEAKQTRFLDEFLVYPPFEKINSMSIEEQNIFFRKELAALQAYFPDGKEYDFDRGEIHDLGSSKKHLEVEEYKLLQCQCMLLHYLS